MYCIVELLYHKWLTMVKLKTYHANVHIVQVNYVTSKWPINVKFSLKKIFARFSTYFFFTPRHLSIFQFFTYFSLSFTVVSSKDVRVGYGTDSVQAHTSERAKRSISRTELHTNQKEPLFTFLKYYNLDIKISI